MNSLPTQSVYRYATLNGPIQTAPFVTPVFTGFFFGAFVFERVIGMDEIRILVPVNNGPAATINVFQGVDISNVIVSGQTHSFVVPAQAGVVPIPPNPLAQFFSFKVSGDCIGMNVSWAVAGGIRLAMGVYGIPGK